MILSSISGVGAFRLFHSPSYYARGVAHFNHADYSGARSDLQFALQLSQIMHDTGFQQRCQQWIDREDYRED